MIQSTRQEEKAREFVFEKTDQVGIQATIEDARGLEDKQKKRYKIERDEGGSPSDMSYYYFEASTDEDSSDD